MKIFSKKAIFVFLLLLGSLLLTSCRKQSRYYKYTINLDPAFHSPNIVEFWVWNEPNKNKYADLAEELNNTLIDLDNKFNIQDRGDGVITNLMKVNNNAGIAPVKVDQEVIDVLKMAIEIAEETMVDNVALYDVTIGPIWQLWEFPDKTFNPMENNLETIPNKDAIEELLPLVNYKNIIINEEEQTIFLKNKGMGIDLGSIVKGYAADKLRDILVSHGIEKAVIDVGRNILILGNYFDRDNDYVDMPFNASIVTPYVNFFTPNYDKVKTFGSLKIDDETIVTSGIYEKYIKDKDKNEYHHILDPRTGFPFENEVVSISVITKESIKGDAYSTALYSMGIKEAMKLVNSKEGLEVIWVIKNNNKYEVYISSGLEGNFEFNQNVEELNYIYKGVYK